VKEVIDIYKGVVIQIATPFSTGTGFYLKDYDFIITNEHVIRDNNEVVIDGVHIKKRMAKVVFIDPKNDLAFLKIEADHKMPALKIDVNYQLKLGEQVVAVGHPFGLKYTATQGIISNLAHVVDDVQYIQHDAALNPGNSGGPLVNSQGSVIGVNTFIIRDGNNIGFSLPLSYLIEALDAFKKANTDSAARCESCGNLVFEHSSEKGYCDHCGIKIVLPHEIENYEPIGLKKTIESMLAEMGYDVRISRRGPNNWELKRGSAIINISYHEKTGLIIGDAFLVQLPKEQIKDIYTYLLRENYKMEGLTFSVKGQDIIISLLIYDKYFNLETGLKLLNLLVEKADHYDDILVNEFGASWKES